MALRSLPLYRVTRRIPFTVALAAAIFCTATITGTLMRISSPAQRARWGFGPADLAAGHGFKLGLALFQVIEPYLGLSVLATVLSLVGACEYRFGTWRTILVFVVSHVTGYLVTIGVARAFVAGGSEWGRRVLAEPMVGASAGAIGTLGAWLMGFPARLRWWGVAGCGAFLLVAFLGDVHWWDVAHAAAFVVGVSIGARFPRDRRTSSGNILVERWFHMRTGNRRTAVAWTAGIVGSVLVLAPFAVVAGMPLAMAAADRWSNGARVVGSIYYAAGWMLLAVTGRLRSGEHRARVLALLASIPAVMVLWQPGAPGMDHILSVLLLAALVAWRDDFRLATPRPTRAGAWRFAVLTMAGAAVFVGYGFFALREHMVPPLDAQACVRLALGRLQGLPAPEPRWYSEGGEWFVAVLPGVVYASLLLSLGAILHAELSRNRDADKGFAG